MTMKEEGKKKKKEKQKRWSRPTTGGLSCSYRLVELKKTNKKKIDFIGRLEVPIWRQVGDEDITHTAAEAVAAAAILWL